MARIMNAIAGNKALSAAVRTTLIEGRRVHDWSFEEFERTMKVLAEVHHVPAPVHASSALDGGYGPPWVECSPRPPCRKTTLWLCLFSR